MDFELNRRPVFNSDSSETVAYNNPLFPAYISYGLLSTYPDYSAISHWHRDLEFIFIEKGKMTYNVDGELVELTKGNGIMVNSRQLHYGFSAEHNECEFICILLSPELLSGNQWFYEHYIEPVTENSGCPYLYLGKDSPQAPILARLNAMYQLCHTASGAAAAEVPSGVSGCAKAEPVPDSCCVPAAQFTPTPSHPALSDPSVYFELIENFVFIMKILYQSLDQKNEVETGECSALNSLRSMITYIEEHYAEHLCLADIALFGACCKSRCCLLFKKYLHDTPITYLTKLRLRKSLADLLESDKSITDIAYAHGFGGASYYCETFKRYYGISPLAYKRQKI